MYFVLVKTLLLFVYTEKVVCTCTVAVHVHGGIPTCTCMYMYASMLMVLCTVCVTEQPDMEYRVLPWRADHQAIKDWLSEQGYGNCVETLLPQIKEGQKLYGMDREMLKDIFGAADGVRLYSRLQSDKPKSEKAAGVAKETDFQVY